MIPVGEVGRVILGLWSIGIFGIHTGVEVEDAGVRVLGQPFGPYR